MPDLKYNKPVLILGQGIAGSCLSLELLEHQIPFRVVDDPWLTNSSKVAAGILNPLIFRYYTLSWRAAVYLDLSKSYYHQQQKEWGMPLIHEVPLLRVFGKDERTMWERKANNPEFARFIEAQPIENLPGINISYGAGLVKSAAWLDTQLFVAQVRERLTKLRLLQQQSWDYQNLVIKDGLVIYEDVEYAAVVFCEGYRAVQNPWLGFVPFRPVKGDVLTVYIDGFGCDYILNKNFFLVPLGNHRFRLGSTYSWTFSDEAPEQQGREKLLGQLQELVKLPIEVIAHNAGVRPAMADRRPIVGKLPGLSNVFVFNGLGSRGGLLAPPLAKYLVQLMLNHSVADAEVSPQRFV